VSDTVLDIITDALLEIEAYGPADLPPSASDAALGLRLLNRELDAWAALKRYVYSVGFTAYTLTPNHQPHLIGPGLVAPDFAATQRPVRIEGADLILPTGVDLPLNLRDDDWWLNQRVKSIATTTPTDLYYSPDWPNGSLFLWPIPTTGYGLRLETWGLISQFAALSDAFSFPPGYKKALVLTLAERLCRPFGRPTRADLTEDAKKARADIQTNNAKSPRIASADFGASGSSGRGAFSYITGQ
jgi:hypothetical protein